MHNPEQRQVEPYKTLLECEFSVWFHAYMGGSNQRFNTDYITRMYDITHEEVKEDLKALHRLKLAQMKGA